MAEIVNARWGVVLADAEHMTYLLQTFAMKHASKVLRQSSVRLRDSSVARSTYEVY